MDCSPAFAEALELQFEAGLEESTFCWEDGDRQLDYVHNLVKMTQLNVSAGVEKKLRRVLLTELTGYCSGHKVEDLSARMETLLPGMMASFTAEGSSASASDD